MPNVLPIGKCTSDKVYMRHMAVPCCCYFTMQTVNMASHTGEKPLRYAIQQNDFVPIIFLTNNCACCVLVRWQNSVCLGSTSVNTCLNAVQEDIVWEQNQVSAANQRRHAVGAAAIYCSSHVFKDWPRCWQE